MRTRMLMQVSVSLHQRIGSIYLLINHIVFIKVVLAGTNTGVCVLTPAY
jgi:hypothetical protein